MDCSDQRAIALQQWVAAQAVFAGRQAPELIVVSGDASFRRYFRARDTLGSWIAVDAPPDKENSQPFVAIAQGWRSQGIQVPEVIASDLTQGFMLLSDFGDCLYLDVLDEARADELYGHAIDALLDIQCSSPVIGYQLPPYDEALLRREMDLFRDWLCGELLGLDLRQSAWFALICDLLVGNAQQQPQVPVHRDYHARNLMLIDGPAPGVLDFQDAVCGPLTYDLVSLLRDCYIRWPQGRVRNWVGLYADRARQRGLLGAGDAQLNRWFDLMGVQRHLKASGIFARLWLRDGKSGYLGDIPRTVDYILEQAQAYQELAPLQDWIRGELGRAMLAHDAFRDSELVRRWVGG